MFRNKQWTHLPRISVLVKRAKYDTDQTLIITES